MMRYARWLTCALAVWAISAAPAAASAAADNAQPKTTKIHRRNKKRRTGALRGAEAVMAKALGLSAEQQAGFKTSSGAEKAELAAWGKENGARLKDLREQAAKIRKELKRLRAARKAIVSKHRAERMAVLTPAQRAKWRVFRLYRTMMGRLRRAKLTDDQAGKVRALCAEAAKRRAGSPADARAARAVLLRKIAGGILTDAQRAELNKPRPKRAVKSGGTKAKKVHENKPVPEAAKKG